MENYKNNNKNGSFFSIEYQLTPEEKATRKEKFNKIKSKKFTFVQNGQKLGGFSPDLIENDFEDLYDLYSDDDPSLELPVELDPKFAEIIIHYFYYREVRS